MPGDRILPAARTRLAIVVLAAAPAVAALHPATGATGPHTGSADFSRVIVSGTVGSLQAVERAVRTVGGHVSRVLPVIDGVAARVPSSAMARLEGIGGVRSVTPDASGHLMGLDPVLGYDVNGDEGSLYDVGEITDAKDAWGANWTGKGVDVALVDSGVAPVAGLTSGNVLNGPDLSFESQNPDLAHLDTFGHGTHMASIIAGRDVVESGAAYADHGTHHFHGIAPDARLLSLKVAANTGATDVSQVIAAIDWVVEHAHDPGFNIRVLNLSYGTDSTQSPSIDPLCYAVENAWRAGIVVVVAAGNDGSARQPLANPAQDPLILAVGADDPRGSDNVNDDVIPSFSQPGTATRHVDLIAPAMHVLGLRDPGSRIDQENPQAVVNDRFFRGTGTSQAAAVVSGLAALYLQKYPSATPDQVKRALMATADVPSSVRSLYGGIGVPDVAKALDQLPTFVQPPTGATGTGSLEAARGTAHVNDGTSDLTGERDIFGQAWNGAMWAAATASGNSWTGGSWNGNSWTGNSWSGNTWSTVTWTGNTWSGNSWTGNSWSGNSWSGNSWTGNSWSGNSWTGNTWSGNSWTGNTWSGNTWSGNTWSDAEWLGASWR